MNISLAIADLNRDYVYRLTEVLQHNRDLNISAFTSLEKLQEALEDTCFDVLLFDPDISKEKIKLSGTKLAICFYSEDCKNLHLYDDCAKVLKYQRVSNIYKFLLNEYADKAGYSIDLNNRTSTKLIGVYSPIGGAGKTTVALALACKLKLHGYSVLFLNTEQFDSSSLVNEYGKDSIAALVESVNNEHVNFKIKLEAITRHGLDDVDYLSGFTRLVDYEAVMSDEISKVMQSIKRDSDYQYVVIDMDSNLDLINKIIFEDADQILLVEKPGEIPTYKMKIFMDQVLVQEKRDKMLRIHNFAENNSNYFNQPNIPVIGKIHNYGNLNLKSIIHAVNSNGEYDIDWILSDMIS